MTTTFDYAAAHRYFAADCFNRVWELLDLPSRTPEQARRMEALAHASVFHWTQREDCTSRSLSIGYWQLARVYAVLGNGPESLRHATTCLGCSQDVPPFYVAYAHEALARAHAVLGDPKRMQEHLAEAAALAPVVEDASSRGALLADLATVRLG